jgi:FdhE protein
MTGAWEARIRRAEQLAARYSFAREILQFYRSVAAFQQKLSTDLRAGAAGRKAFSPTSLRDAFDISAILPHFPELLELVARVGPRPLATAAKELESRDRARREEMLTAYFFAGSLGDSPLEPLPAFFARAVLEPYAEVLTALVPRAPWNSAPLRCPLCGARPVCGVLRREGDGGKRFLLCSFCATEWEFRRILCPCCGEEDEKKLPVYVAEQFSHIRVEACETCKFSLRTIDLTTDGHAIPLVDDLAAIPLSLWAEEHGYQRRQPNLLGS